jgi:multicomponent Na+:H+ antiporter subunit B
MKDLILPTATAYLMPVLLLFSLFLLLRGHNEPGGGFAGGLVAATAFVLLSIAAGVDSARRALGVDPRTLFGCGLFVIRASPSVTGSPSPPRPSTGLRRRISVLAMGGNDSKG